MNKKIIIALLAALLIIAVGFLLYAAKVYYDRKLESQKIPKPVLKSIKDEKIFQENISEKEPNKIVEKKFLATDVSVVESSRLAVSPNRQRFAYMKSEGIPGKQYAVIDGIEQKKYDSVSSPFIFSPDNQHIAYGARESGEEFIVLDGVEQKKYKAISYYSFSPDGRHFAYIALRNDEKQFMVIDGVEQKVHERIYNFAFSPDGQHEAYLALEKGKKFVVLDGIEQKKYKDIIQMEANKYFIFSPDSRHLAYIVREGGGYQKYQSFVVLDGAEQEKYDGVNTNFFTFSPDSEHFAYPAFRGQESYTIVDGVEHKIGDIYEFIFMSDNKYVYSVVKPGGTSVVSGGIEQKMFPLAVHLVLSPDDQKIAYEVWEGYEKYIVLNDVAQKKYDSIGEKSFSFSNDSRHWAYIAMEGEKCFVVLDNVEQEKYNCPENVVPEPLTFSLDDKYLTYNVIENNNLLMVRKEISE